MEWKEKLEKTFHFHIQKIKIYLLEVKVYILFYRIYNNNNNKTCILTYFYFKIQ